MIHVFPKTDFIMIYSQISHLATSYKILSILILYLFINPINCIDCTAQNKLSIEVCNKNTLSNSITIPDNKFLLVFKSSDILSFKSQRNNSLLEATKEIDQYNLFCNPVTDVITVLNKAGLSFELKFSNDNSENKSNTYQVPKSGETMCFKINASFQLIVGNSEGDVNFKHRNALVIIKVVPNSLELTFKSTKQIIEVEDKRKDEGRYLIHMEPVKQILTIGTRNFDDNQISFNTLPEYPVLYYNVTVPDTSGFYSIKSVPPGALIEIEGLQTFNKQRNRTPYGFTDKCGHYNITLSHEKYDTIKDEIDICAADKKESSFTLAPSYGIVRLDVRPKIEKTSVIYHGNSILPIKEKDFQFPKGNVSFILQSPGFVSDTVSLNLLGGDTVSLTKYLVPLKGVEITIFTKPTKVNFQIENEKAKTKRSPFTLKLSPGDYKVWLDNALFYPKQTELKVIPNQIGYYFDLAPKSFTLNLKIKGRKKEKYLIFIDDKSNGNIDHENRFSKQIPAGVHSLKIVSEKSNKTLFTSNIEQTNSTRTKVIWFPSLAAWSLGGIGSISPSYYFSNAFQNNFKEPTVYSKPSFFLDFIVISLAGLSVQPIQIEQSNSTLFPDSPYIVSWINPEFRVGFNITNWFDFSLFFNAYYKNNPFYEIKQGKQSTFFDIRGYKYGIAFNIFPHTKYRWSWASMTLRAGIRDENFKYHIWDGYQSLPTNQITEYSPFISLTLNVLTYGDGMVLRVFKKPLSHAGAF